MSFQQKPLENRLFLDITWKPPAFSHAYMQLGTFSNFAAAKLLFEGFQLTRCEKKTTFSTLP
jgi:hypothetical protein